MIDGLQHRALAPLTDLRGDLTELWRASWSMLGPITQWNLLRSSAGVLRGVRVHPRHDEVIVIAQGKVRLGLHDMRPDSTTFGQGMVVDLDADDPSTVLLSHGVAHGFLNLTDSILCIGMANEFDPEDDIGVHWADPELNIDWGLDDPVVSPRDAASPPLRTVLRQLTA